jgi:ferredoxin
MVLKKVYSIYFSPTGTTEKATNAFAAGTGLPYEKVDLTLPKNRQVYKHTFSKNELVIAGIPVYGGRLPKNLDDFFSGMKGNGAAAAALVMYGNREYNDALMELKIRLEERGFNVIAGAAFIGEHTFSKNIATGRPDENDLAIAEDFGRKAISFIVGEKQGVLRVKGSYPYEWRGYDPADFRPKPDRPIHPSVSTNERCTSCGLCAENCPWGVIDTEDYTLIDNTKCMRCFRCIKNCPVAAKEVTDKNFFEFLPEFERRLNAVLKMPELFLPE